MIYYFESEIKMPLMKLPLRATLLQGNGFLILVSPIQFTAAQVEEIKKKGEVTDIVAPSLFHHSFVPQALEHFPKATLWAAPGLPEKRTDIRWHKVLEKDPWPYVAEVETSLLSGAPKLNEVVFLHKPSKTLIVTDMCFNLQNSRGLGAYLILSLFGTYRKFGVSKFWLNFVKNREQFRSSALAVLEWDFDKIVMAHGEIVTSGGKALLQRALAERGLRS